MGQIRKIDMRKAVTVIMLLASLAGVCQINCEAIRAPGTSYQAVNFKHGKGKLLPTDSAITNQMKQKIFELKLVSNLSPAEKDELAKYKIKFNETDTIMFYDWDILHNGKVGYFGPAVARVRFTCTDSMFYTQKYLLKKDEAKYVPNQFKIIRMNESDFIINDRIHPYMNINYYFKK